MSALFEQALDRPAEDRKVFLEQACGQDRRLLRALEALLEADGEAGDFLEEPVLPRRRPSPPRTPPAG